MHLVDACTGFEHLTCFTSQTGIYQGGAGRERVFRLT